MTYLIFTHLCEQILKFFEGCLGTPFTEAARVVGAFGENFTKLHGFNTTGCEIIHRHWWTTTLNRVVGRGSGETSYHLSPGLTAICRVVLYDVIKEKEPTYSDGVM